MGNGILDGILGAFSPAQWVDKALDTVKAYLPPSMSQEQKAELEIKLRQQGWEHEKEGILAMAEAEKRLDERVAMYEGTASDLKSIPIVGPVLLFFRGAQRPIIGYAMMYLDYMVFSGQWDLDKPVTLSAFYALNLLVGGFLFGERAIQNVAPYIKDIVAAKKAG